MELVGGGTLRDRVTASGPLPASEAVDAILQIIAGLDAARQAGVLHRDVKPSNCFIDADGAIKIGDFGLSISTTVRTESNLTGPGSLFGTPAYSSVEQLRGEELTVRSDIYSVGVTLYYLLTGRLPFEAPNTVQLLAMVLEQHPQSPAKLRDGIPDGLGRAVLRCLNKDPGARYADYAALRRALLPYASFSPSPATLPLRFLAWIIDGLILGVPNYTLMFVTMGDLSAIASPGHRGARLLCSTASMLMTILYFSLFEGLRGASPGKALCHLRVVGLDGRIPGMRKALIRVLIFSAFWLPGMMLTCFMPQQIANPLSLITTVIQLLVFCTCRRLNGFAGLHDLWSKTRVVSRSVQPVRPALSLTPEAPPATGNVPQAGPYHVLGEVGRSGDVTVLLGYDAQLLRKVWLRRVAPGTPPVAAALCHLARPGRLRWIDGRRSNDDCWDAYENPGGQPLLNLVSMKHDWAEVRFWLLDLAGELQACDKDGSLPAVLGLDRVWITADGRAKLLDFPAPGTHWPQADQPAKPGEFLRQTAFSALEGRPVSLEQARFSTLAMPLPLDARGFLQRLETAADAGHAWAQLKPLTSKVPTITRRRRLAIFGMCLIFPLFITFCLALGNSALKSQG
jgi:uncharacterized RDD family membrane protein YckC